MTLTNEEKKLVDKEVAGFFHDLRNNLRIGFLRGVLAILGITLFFFILYWIFPSIRAN